MASDFALFLGEMMRRPTEVVAIAPSSAATARLMTRGLERTSGPIVEIGPGTGSFTKAILESGVAPERLTLLEMNPRFCAILADKFRGVRVVNRPAQDIKMLGLTEISAVISGVPVLSRPTIQREVVGRALDVMAADGFVNQITYSPQSPISPEMQQELGLTSQKLGTVWANLPPARVFQFSRQRH
ncbi:class I SAM-dependent methyltransferase [Cognatishimia maritima]|uniref:Phosphatidylethanolamine/phosphatidyl-N-methylethanolamine N-methyltransferase n=1 Tax=Cognatishimia maritima TaxID=870908 RepID=A0A1M5IKV5_9RHOB|nr:rRNA adenine N-6-methyltransferase family protein [Cognatishimia maritima]SHG28901.1 phosphatidylethanolamine/phosphatidyl-N-methylethanolamine N-methyltransferase [Cognatishimia maritima]